MKILILLLIAATFVMGLYDGGDITASILLAIFFLPAVFNRKKDGEEI